MNKNVEIKFVCEKCGKNAPIDKKQSNENWVVYKNEPCECGGKFIHKLVVKEK